MEIRERFNFGVIRISAPLKTIAQKNAMTILKMPPIQLSAVFLEKYVLRISKILPQLRRECLRLSKSRMHEDRVVGIVLLVIFERRLDSHSIFKQDTCGNSLLLKKASPEQFRDVGPIIGMIAIIRVNNNNSPTTLVTDRFQRPLQSAQRLPHRFDNRHESGFGKQLRHLANCYQLELLSSEIWVVHSYYAQVNALSRGVRTASSKRS
ncbi:hypothetical protein X963_5677 [Burkholderia pseudomallei MSHR7498]|nr:hypothetical protein X942_2590 [Burkholderia pseudomallei MSHR5596]KGS91872.1 hypothetical protein X963_5677 [Burkholderia pseudomallei MSHR7498]